MNNDAVIAIVTYADSLIDQLYEASFSIDPEYGYQNEINEEMALEMKQEFRTLLNAVLFARELS